MSFSYPSISYWEFAIVKMNLVHDKYNKVTVKIK